MHKSKTTCRKLYILCCLITCPENWGRGGGAYSRGGAYFKFRLIGGALIRRGRLFEGGGGALIRRFTVYALFAGKPSIVVFMLNYSGRPHAAMFVVSFANLKYHALSCDPSGDHVVKLPEGWMFSKIKINDIANLSSEYSDSSSQYHYPTFQ